MKPHVKHQKKWHPMETKLIRSALSGEVSLRDTERPPQVVVKSILQPRRGRKSCVELQFLRDMAETKVSPNANDHAQRCVSGPKISHLDEHDEFDEKEEHEISQLMRCTIAKVTHKSVIMQMQIRKLLSKDTINEGEFFECLAGIVNEFMNVDMKPMRMAYTDPPELPENMLFSQTCRLEPNPHTFSKRKNSQPMGLMLPSQHFSNPDPFLMSQNATKIALLHVTSAENKKSRYTVWPPPRAEPSHSADKGFPSVRKNTDANRAANRPKIPLSISKRT